MARPLLLLIPTGSSKFLGFQGVLALFFLFSLAISVSADDSASIRDLLRDHGLPAGLLPKNVRSFSLDQATGLLEVNLDRPCYAKYDDLVYFDRVVRGNLSYGELKGVMGLSQEELFLWLPVKGIQVSDPDSGVILFDIGVAHKRLSMSLFEDPPNCKPEGKEIGSGLKLEAGTKGKGFSEQR